MLTTPFLLIAFLLLCYESDEGVSDDESDDEGFGSGFTYGLRLSSFLNYSLIMLVDFCLK